MPLYKIEEPQKRMQIINPSTFADVKMREKQDLQALLRDNSDVIAPDLLVFAEEFSDWEDSLRRVDLLAIDKDASLVVIELKRVEEGGHMELQAIRYAAMLSAMRFEDVVSAYKKLLANVTVASKRGIDSDGAEQALLTFLNAESVDDVTISSTPSIILMSPSFSKEITTTVLWLNDRDLDIRCLEVKPYEIDNQIYLDVEQVIPLPSADAYTIQMREKAKKAERKASAGRSENTIPILVGKGLLKTSTPLVLLRTPRQSRGTNITDAKAKQATFLDSHRIRWEYDGIEYSSLNSLCLKIIEIFGDGSRGALQGPDYWAIPDDTKTLAQRAKAPDQPSGQASIGVPGSAIQGGIGDTDTPTPGGNSDAREGVETGRSHATSNS